MRPRLSASCLLFDMDGTLIDATKLIERIWISWCRRHRIGPEQLLAESRGQRIVDTVRKYAPNADVDAEVEWLSRQAHEEPAGPDAMPGAATFLQGAPRNRWAVVTSAKRALATHWLAAAGLPLPPVCITGDDVSQGKPDPSGYLLGLAQLSCAPSQAVVFEDAAAGIEAAQRAGIPVIGVSNPGIQSHPALSFWVPDFTYLSLLRDDDPRTCIIAVADRTGR